MALLHWRMMKGVELRVALAKAGVSGSELAKRLSVHRSTVSRWTREEVPVPDNRVGQIREVLK